MLLRGPIGRLSAHVLLDEDDVVTVVNEIEILNRNPRRHSVKDISPRVFRKSSHIVEMPKLSFRQFYHRLVGQPIYERVNKVAMPFHQFLSPKPDCYAVSYSQDDEFSTAKHVCQGMSC